MGLFDKFGGFGSNDKRESDDLMEERFESMNENSLGTEPIHNDNIISFQAASAAARGDTTALLRMKVVVIEPKTFDDSQQIANYLKDRKPVLINFENTDSDVAMRIVDFVSGTTYALNGEIKKVSHHVFLCAPNNVNVSYTQDKNSGSDLPWLNK